MSMVKKYFPLGPSLSKKQAEDVIGFRRKEFRDKYGVEIGMKADEIAHFIGNHLAMIRSWSIRNYSEISQPSLTHFPLVKYKIFYDKILEPLKAAKLSFCYRQYISTIAVCGLTAEMLCILLWKTHVKIINDHNVEDKILLGKEFERLPQEVRIRLLLAFGIIDKNQWNLFTEIKDLRNDYMHDIKKITVRVQPEAIRIYKLTVKLLIDILKTRKQSFWVEMKKINSTLLPQVAIGK